MCDCNNQKQNKNDNLNYDCEVTNCNSSCEYLKPLSMDRLFATDECNDFHSVLCKAKKVRNAFFAAKSSVKNFVTNVEDILLNLSVDLSDNEIELDSVRKNYFQAVSTLNNSLFASLKISCKGDQLMNINSFNINNEFDRNVTVQKSKPFYLDTKISDCETDIVTLTHVPGVSIEHNTDTKVSRLYFYEPKINENFHNKFHRDHHKRVADEVQSFITTPSIKCFDDILSIVDNSLNDSTVYNGDDDGASDHETSVNDAFENLDLTVDFLEEIQNYQDNTVLDTQNICNNQLLQVMNYFDFNINKFENTHRYVVQLCKITEGSI